MTTINSDDLDFIKGMTVSNIFDGVTEPFTSVTIKDDLYTKLFTIQTHNNDHNDIDPWEQLFVVDFINYRYKANGYELNKIPYTGIEDFKIIININTNPNNFHCTYACTNKKNHLLIL